MSDYNSINWHDIFYYDATSASGLRWKTDIRNLQHRKRILVAKDAEAGTRMYRPNKKPKAWVVVYDGKQYAVHRIIVVLLKGSIENDKVVDHLDRNPFNNVESNLKIKTRAENNRNANKFSTNKTGVTGVCLIYNKTIPAYAATWSINGRSYKKNFSCAKYGQEEAFRLACEYRKSMIELLHSNGHYYEENHGR